MFYINFIRTLETSGHQDETVVVSQLKQQLQDLQVEAMRLQQNEMHRKQDVERLQDRYKD